jgi:FAD/FMN-containing dehydrogenase
MLNDMLLSRRQFAALVARFIAALAVIFSLPGRAYAKVSGAADLTDALKNKIDGEVVARDHELYEAWRTGKSWQLRKTRRRPDIIVQPNSVSDVVEAVKISAESGLEVGIRSGGHSWVASSVRDSGMLLDMGKFRALEINAENKTAIVGPAISARELANALQEFNLGFPVAHCSNVALGGYLLGGGQAWNWGSWGGPACNSVEALDVVTARGEVIQIDQDNHPDLFWAARGAGPGFPAVVTNYHLKLYALPKAIHMSTFVWPLKDTLPVSDWFTKVGAVLSDKVELFMFLLTVPEPIDGVSQVVTVTAVAFADTVNEARGLLEPMSAANALLDPISSEEFKPTTMNSLLNLVDRSFPPCRAAADTFWFDVSMQEVMAKYADHFATAPSPLSNVLCEVKPKPIVFSDAAYSMRRLTYLSPYAFWNDQKDDQKNLAWMRKTQEILGPMSVGHYINEADLEASPSRSERSFSQESWQRIGAVREKYDPGGVFHTYLSQA